MGTSDPIEAGGSKQTYTVEEAAALIGISRSTAYECVRNGQLPSLRFRRRIVVPAYSIQAMLTSYLRLTDPTTPDMVPHDTRGQIR